jgi:phosphatidylglycerophosphatase A
LPAVPGGGRGGSPLTLADRTASLVATAGGLGHAPLAPGTAASLPPVVLAWLLAPSDAVLVAAAVAVTGLGIWAGGREERRLGVLDPSTVVVDEVAGMLVALVGHPRTLGWGMALFLLFRVMDVWKPFPIRRLQDLPGGWGIVLDDVLAAVYASLLGHLARWALAA